MLSKDFRTQRAFFTAGKCAFGCRTGKQVHHRRCRNSISKATGSNGGDADAVLRQAMQDPQVAKQMQEYEEKLKDPAVQAQTQQLSQVMQSPEMVKKMAELQEDPELQPMFEEMAKGGVRAMMKYMNDPIWLAKVGEKLGDVEFPLGAAAAAPTPKSPEITNLVEAAKYHLPRFGDLEAVEDFLAIGKDVNQTDPECRTALHYAVAYKHKEIFYELLASGADLAAMDSQGNNPLHYAAGYGRGEFVKDLIDAGAKGFSKNNNGQTPCDLVRMEKKNPINNDRELMKLLEVASSS